MPKPKTTPTAPANPPNPPAATSAAAATILDAVIARPLNTKQAKARVSKTAQASLTLRQALWPDMGDANLWLRTDKSRKGFTTIPRCMPLFMEIIADASKRVTSGKSMPAGKAYLVLWCRVFDEGIVKIDDEATAAFEAGYSGERKITTWREHLKVLKDLGFIDFKPGAASPSQIVLLLNPYHAVKRLQEKGWVQAITYTTLLQRALDVGATDLEDEV